MKLVPWITDSHSDIKSACVYDKNISSQPLEHLNWRFEQIIEGSKNSVAFIFI